MNKKWSSGAVKVKGESMQWRHTPPSEAGVWTLSNLPVCPNFFLSKSFEAKLQTMCAECSTFCRQNRSESNPDERMEPQTKRQPGTIRRCQRGSGQPLPGEEASRADSVDQLLALTDALEERRSTWAQRARLLRLEGVQPPGEQLWRLHQCLVHMDSIALQLFDYNQVCPRQHFITTFRIYRSLQNE